jgi:hypothetical protein
MHFNGTNSVSWLGYGIHDQGSGARFPEEAEILVSPDRLRSPHVLLFNGQDILANEVSIEWIYPSSTQLKGYLCKS